MAKVSRNVWGEILTESLVSKNNILSMGLVSQENTDYPGDIYQMPIQQGVDIAITSHTDITAATTTVSPVTYADVQQNFVFQHKGAALYDTNFDILNRGADGLLPLVRQIMPNAINLIQTSLVSATKGAFTTTLATSNYKDRSSTGLPTVNDIQVALQELVGETMFGYDTLILHSVHAVALQEKFHYVSAGEQGANVIFTGTIPMLAGYKVVINDSLCAPETVGNATYYPVFVAKGQPWKLIYQKDLSIYEDFDTLTGGGKKIMAYYLAYAPAVNGVSYTSATYKPTDAQLETGGSWTKVMQAKNIGLVKLLYAGS